MSSTSSTPPAMSTFAYEVPRSMRASRGALCWSVDAPRGGFEGPRRLAKCLHRGAIRRRPPTSSAGPSNKIDLPAAEPDPRPRTDRGRDRHRRLPRRSRSRGPRPGAPAFPTCSRPSSTALPAPKGRARRAAQGDDWSDSLLRPPTSASSVLIRVHRRRWLKERATASG